MIDVDVVDQSHEAEFFEVLGEIGTLKAVVRRNLVRTDLGIEPLRKNAIVVDLLIEDFRERRLGDMARIGLGLFDEFLDLVRFRAVAYHAAFTRQPSLEELHI